MTELKHCSAKEFHILIYIYTFEMKVVTTEIIYENPSKDSRFSFAVYTVRFKT